MEGEGDVELLNCKICSRRFREDVLRKHEPICIKNSKKKRKVFESGKQRAEGSDVPISKVLKPGEVPKADPKQAIAEARTRQWRDKHESLVEAFRAARNYAKAKSEGGPLPPPPPAVIDPSLVQCPYCGRRFNEEAAKRHEPFCKDQQAKLGGPRGGAARTAYKPPPLKSRPQAPPPQQQPRKAVPNGASTRPRESPPTMPPPKSRSETAPMRAATPKTSVPTRAAPRPSPGAPPVSTQPRGSLDGARRTPAGSQLPRAAASGARRAPAAAPPPLKPAAGFCHECGSTFAVASARFCSECGVRRLAL